MHRGIPLVLLLLAHSRTLLPNASEENDNSRVEYEREFTGNSFLGIIPPSVALVPSK
jgi:hypothetical protein